MMTNKEILRTAMEQSAVDANCQPEDFMKTEPVIVTSRKNPAARRYLKLPLACNLISYGNNIVASIDGSSAIIRFSLASYTAVLLPVILYYIYRT